jgi:hypothetical protein
VIENIDHSGSVPFRHRFNRKSHGSPALSIKSQSNAQAKLRAEGATLAHASGTLQAA